MHFKANTLPVLILIFDHCINSNNWSSTNRFLAWSFEVYHVFQLSAWLHFRISLAFP
eukprot:UN03894